MNDLEERFSGPHCHNTSGAPAPGPWIDASNTGGQPRASWNDHCRCCEGSLATVTVRALPIGLGREGSDLVADGRPLGQSGLVVREPWTTDRRVKHILLTDAGNEPMAKVRTEAAALPELLAASTRRICSRLRNCSNASRQASKPRGTTCPCRRAGHGRAGRRRHAGRLHAP